MTELIIYLIIIFFSEISVHRVSYHIMLFRYIQIEKLIIRNRIVFSCLPSNLWNFLMNTTSTATIKGKEIDYKNRSAMIIYEFEISNKYIRLQNIVTDIAVEWKNYQ